MILAPAAPAPPRSQMGFSLLANYSRPASGSASPPSSSPWSRSAHRDAVSRQLVRALPRSTSRGVLPAATAVAEEGGGDDRRPAPGQDGGRSGLRCADLAGVLAVVVCATSPPSTSARTLDVPVTANSSPSSGGERSEPAWSLERLGDRPATAMPYPQDRLRACSEYLQSGP